VAEGGSGLRRQIAEIRVGDPGGLPELHGRRDRRGRLQDDQGVHRARPPRPEREGAHRRGHRREKGTSSSRPSSARCVRT
jgi:hypothetical protein